MHRVVTTPQSLKSPLSSPWQDLGPGSAESYFKHCIFSTYPNSRSEEFILCASWSRSPSALVFFTLSLPARSQLRETKLTIAREASVTLSLFNNNWPWKGVINLSRLRTLSAVEPGGVMKLMNEKYPASSLSGDQTYSVVMHIAFRLDSRTNPRLFSLLK